MRSVTKLAVLSALAGLMLASGCVGRLIDEGIEKGLGPTAKVCPLEPRLPAEAPNFLAAYKNFELASPVKSEFPDTPGEFMNYFPTRLQEQLASKGLPTGKSGKTLLIGVTILGYQPVSSYNKVLGPTEEVIARVELTDKDTGKLVAKAICIGRTYQSVGLGPKWKAWGLSRAIVNNWIDNCYPKEGRVEGDEKAPASEGKEAPPPADNK